MRPKQATKNTDLVNAANNQDTPDGSSKPAPSKAVAPTAEAAAPKEGGAPAPAKAEPPKAALISINEEPAAAAAPA